MASGQSTSDKIIGNEESDSEVSNTTDSDYGENPNDLFAKRKCVQDLPSKLSGLTAQTIESNIIKGQNIIFYLTHKDKLIRKKAKRIYNRIHGAGEHLRIIADHLAGNNKIVNNCVMAEQNDEISTLKSENQRLNNQIIEMQKTMDGLLTQINELNANISKLISLNNTQNGNNTTTDNFRENTDSNMNVDLNNETLNNGCNSVQTPKTVQNESTANESFAQLVKKNKNHLNNVNNSSHNNSTKVNKNDKNITPLVVTIKSIDEKNGLLTQIKRTFGRSVTLLGVGGTKIKISADTSEHRIELIGFLKQNEYNFHTFCPANEKRIDIVIKGLPFDDENYNQQTISEAVKEWGHQPISVRLINKPRNDEQQLNGYANWHVSLPHNTNTTELFGKKRIEQCIVHVELLKKKTITQCYKCLEFHHTASNCFHQTKCLICAENHKASECTLGKNIKPKCANCGGDHVATHLSVCPAYQKAIQNSKSVKSEIITGSVTKKVIKQLQSQIANVENKQSSIRKRDQNKSNNSHTDDPMIPASTPSNNPTKKKKNKSDDKNNKKSNNNNQLTIEQIAANFQQLFEMFGALQNTILKNNA